MAVVSVRGWIALGAIIFALGIGFMALGAATEPSTDTVDRYRGGTAPAWYREAMHWRAIAKVQGATADRLLRLNRKLLKEIR